MSGPARSRSGMPRAAFSEAAFGALRAASGAGQGEALRIPLADIDEDPGQPRTVFDDDGLAELAASIREHGVVQPVVVRPPVDGRYTLAVGARRLRASRLAGLADIPAVIRRAGGDAFAAQVIENQQRAALSNSDLAAAIARLAGAGHSNRQIATICALKDYQVAAFKQAGHFPPELRARLDRGDMRALYDLYRQWTKTPDAVIAALAGVDGVLTVTEARRIIGGITGAPTGSLVLERPAAARPAGEAVAVAAAPGPVPDGGLHGARPAAPETGRRSAARQSNPAADAPRGAPVFRVATGDGRTGRLVLDRKAARPGAALVAFAGGTEAVDAAELRIVGVD